MLNQFSIQYFKSSFNLSMYDLSMNDVFTPMRKLLVPMLFLALFVSTGASAGYDNIKVTTYPIPEPHVDIKFKGQPPQSLDGFDQYTIDKFGLKIGDSDKKHPVTKHADTALFTSFKNYKELDKTLNQSSYLVLTWDLSGYQASSEGLKCIRKHADWWGFWWLKAPFKDCLAKVWNAFSKHQTYNLEITAELKQSVEQELKWLRSMINVEKILIKGYLIDMPKDYFNSPEKFKVRTDSVLAREQSRVIFGIATHDYFIKKSIFSKTFEHTMLIKNLLENLEPDSHIPDDKDYFGFTGFAYTGYQLELFKAFSSKDCKNQLSQKIIDNITNSSRLVSAANDYANHVCKFNLISFAEGNKFNYPTPVEFNDSHTNPENLEYQPYVFCDGLTCQFNISQTHKYRLVDHRSAVSAMTSRMAVGNLYDYIHVSKYHDESMRLCSDSDCVFLIDDLNRVNGNMDLLKYETNYENSESSWTFIEIDE